MCPLPPEHPSRVSPHPIPPGCLEYSCFTMLYSVLLYRKVNQLYTYISLLCFGFPPHLCHLIGQLVKNLPAMQETPVWSLGWEDPLEKGKATCSRFLGLPYGSGGKESACNAGDLGSIPWLRRSPGEGNGNPLQKCIPLHSHQQCMGDPSTSSFFPILGIISLFNFSHFS